MNTNCYIIFSHVTYVVLVKGSSNIASSEVRTLTALAIDTLDAKGEC